MTSSASLVVMVLWTLCTSANASALNGSARELSVASTFCDAIHNHDVQEISNTVFTTAMGAAGMPSFGTMALKWGAKLAVNNFIAPKVCKESSSAEAFDECNTQASTMMGDFTYGPSGHRTLFSTTFPEDSESSNKCAPYPKTQAQFCSDLGHDHPVKAVFGDHPNFADARATHVELAWLKVKNEKTMKKMIDSNFVCKDSIKDALCIDAFPPCHTEDHTTCDIICRNIRRCFTWLFDRKGEQDESSMSNIVHKCKTECADNKLAMGGKMRVAGEDSSDSEHEGGSSTEEITSTQKLVKVSQGAIVTLKGAGTDHVNGIYTAMDTGATAMNMGAPIQFFSKTNVIRWYPHQIWPEAWYIDDTTGSQHWGLYINTDGDKDHFPLEGWTVFPLKPPLYSGAAEGALPAPTVEAPSNELSEAFAITDDGTDDAAETTTMSPFAKVIGATGATAVLGVAITGVRRVRFNMLGSKNAQLEDADEQYAGVNVAE